MILKETDDSVQKEKKKCGSLHYKGWKEISSSDNNCEVDWVLNMIIQSYNLSSTTSLRVKEISINSGNEMEVIN